MEPQQASPHALLGGCGCAQCAGLRDGGEGAGDGLAGVGGGKPILSLDSIISNFGRSNALWPQGSNIGYSFRENLPPGANDIQFRAFTDAERQAVRLGFDLISDVANLTFTELPDDGRATNMGNRIYFMTDTVRDASDAGVWGYAQRYGFGSRIASANVVTYSAATAERAWIVAGYNFNAMMHEQLHTLGIPHPGNYNASDDSTPITYAANAQYAQDSRQFTIMSYFPASATGSDHLADSRGNGLFSASTPLLHDVAALQAMYGANMNTRTGDTVYGYNSNTGRPSYTLSADQTAANLITNFAPIFTIWDAGGIDLIDFSLTQFRVNLDMNAGAFSDAFEMTNNISIAYNVVIEDAFTGSADDRILGNAANNHFRGGAGNDNIFGQDGDDLIGGQDGDDFIDGGQGADNLFGDAGRDHMVGGIDNDRLHGQDGDDLIGGQDGDDFIDGGQGADTLFGDAGRDHMVGGIDNDRLHGQDGDDLIGGQDGDDFIDGGNGRDTLFGDAGRDHIIGGADNDRLHGQDGDDLMGGQDGDDYLEGGAGRDTLYGDAGNDVIVGGAGADNLFGQAGADRFVFLALSDSFGPARDRIFDFNAAEGDLIDISAIDADANLAGDQAFTLVGGFSGRAGQAVLSFDAGLNTTTLSLDANGDGLADFVLDINGNVSAGLVL
jgi:serralysin